MRKQISAVSRRKNILTIRPAMESALLQVSLWLSELTIFQSIPGSLHSSACFLRIALHFPVGIISKQFLGNKHL